MHAVDAIMTQHGEVVARACALFLPRSEQPVALPWTTPIKMPPLPAQPRPFDESEPMAVTAIGDQTCQAPQNPWQYDGPRFAWIRPTRPLVDDETPSPFVNTALAVDITACLTGFSTAGLQV